MDAILSVGAPTRPASGDADLVMRARAGDRQALGLLLRRHRSAIERMCRRMCPEPAQLDDIVQETYMAIVRSIGSFRHDSGFLTWVYTLARTHRGRALRSSARERARRERLERSSPTSAAAQWGLDEHVATREMSRAFERALAPLKPTDRMIVLMRDVEGYTAQEIARTLGLTVPAVKTRLHRARVALRQDLFATRTPLDS